MKETKGHQAAVSCCDVSRNGTALDLAAIPAAAAAADAAAVVVVVAPIAAFGIGVLDVSLLFLWFCNSVMCLRASVSSVRVFVCCIFSVFGYLQVVG